MNVPLGKAFFYIFFSVFVISGIPWLAFGGCSYLWKLRSTNPQYNIVALVQTCEEPLQTSFLAELLGFLSNRSMNIYKFDLKLAKTRLLNFPVIQDAEIKRVLPGILYIDYSLRKPVALIGDFFNTALDKEFVPFPVKPFFFEENLPVFYLGIEKMKWGQKIQDERLKLAFDVLSQFQKKELNPSMVDVSKANATSLGDEKIIVEISSHFIVLSTKNIEEGVDRYLAFLQEEISKQSLMLDLRIPYIGYFQSLFDEN